jgi:bifunctional non-homologous end joining protein LigD
MNHGGQYLSTYRVERESACFVAFDLLWLDGEDLRALPLVDRKRRLKRLPSRRSNHLIAGALSIESEGRKLFDAVEEHDLEVIVAKRPRGSPL